MTMTRYRLPAFRPAPATPATVQPVLGSAPAASTIPHHLQPFFGQAFFRDWGVAGVYRPHNPPRPGQAHRLCDYLIYFRDRLILIALPELLFEDEQPMLEQLQAFRKKQVHRARRNLDQTEAYIRSGQPVYADVDCRQPWQPGSLARIDKICITTLMERTGSGEQAVLHGYDRAYYEEEQIGDETSSPVQMFSAGAFTQLVQVLDNFADLLNYLTFQSLLIADETQPFDCENDLLNRFIEEGHVFAHARMLAEMQQPSEPRLIRFWSPVGPEQALATFKQVRQESALWDQFAAAYRQRLREVIQPQQGMQAAQTLADYRWLLSSLVDECHASRWRLAQVLLLRLGQPRSQDGEALVAVCRSYTRAERLFLFCFYSEQAGHAHARAQLQGQLSEQGRQVAAQQLVPVQEVIVVGVSTEQGLPVSADVVYVRV